MSKGPFSINGVGWKYYGQRDFASDGSFITTEWFVIFHIPIFPLRSYRVIKHGRESVVGPFYQKENYSVSKPMGPDFKQVILIYIYTFALVALTVYLALHLTTLAQTFGPVGVFAGSVICGAVFLLLPGFSRGLAMRKVGLRRVRKGRRRRH